MPAVSVAGAAFTVEFGSPAVAYESQVTTGTVTTTPTIVRTKTLDSVAFDQTDLNSTMAIEFLYDENSGLYDVIQTAIAAASPIAVVVSSATGSWTGSSMSIESAEMTVEAAGIATCSVSLTGTVVFA
jgi:hypothetical protein